MSPAAATADAASPTTVLERYREVRAWSDTLCEPLVTEDYVIQSMPDASPSKWHLAHTTWFFETFLLAPRLDAYRSPDPRFNYLFNSYYNTIGEQYARPERGLISRPTVAEVESYRRHVDEHVARLLEGAGQARLAEILPLVEIGLNHEQQHQELMLTDLKHMFSKNPLHPVYRPARPATAAAPELAWHAFSGGLRRIGHDGADGFAFDNEGPRHRVFVEAFRIASRLVTCGEYLEFMADGGYERPELWLSDGWSTVRAQGWTAPLYWSRGDGGWRQFTLGGLREVEPAEPVCHVSLYEADAYARWAGARLPSEAEWEIAADDVLGAAAARGDAAPEANLAEDGHYHPRPLAAASRHGQFLGDVWEWTRSAYTPYPGYRPPPGALGEYNAKFMSSQVVLRGGSCATPRSHVRTTYRNFFPPSTRWQFMGLRLAQDA
jgi:ergothioneine biosynthesis protein EgtB